MLGLTCHELIQLCDENVTVGEGGQGEDAAKSNDVVVTGEPVGGGKLCLGGASLLCT